MRMNIEAERARNGLTKTKLSEILGISLPTYNSYISGGSIPSDVLDKMADLFGTTPITRSKQNRLDFAVWTVLFCTFPVFPGTPNLLPYYI